MSLSGSFSIPPKIGESPTFSGYLEVTGRHVDPEGFNVYLTSLIGNTRGRVHIITDEGWKEREIALRFDGVSWPHGNDNVESYTAEILLKPGRYTVKPKEPKS